MQSLPKKKYYSSICLVIKNDHDLLIEWIEHYRRIGFDHMYIIDNGTIPPHRNFLHEHIMSGYITYLYTKEDSIQIQAYNYILNQFRHETTWLAYFDTDELLVLKQHANINEFLREYEEHAAVSVCWYIFGSNGHKTHQESTILSYYKRVKADDLINGQYFYKTIVMTDRTVYHQIHNAWYIDGYTAVDESKTPTYVYAKPLSVERIRTNIIQLNHYVIRSLEDFQEKSKRGTCGGNGVKTMEYYHITDEHANEEYDWSIIERHYPEYLYKKIEVEEAAKIMTIPKKKYYSSVCLIIKNDHDLLDEWIRHYRRIGFEHIYLIDNGTNPPHEIHLREYIQNGYITYVYNTQFPYQIQGYNDILNQYRQETTWLAYFDSDEFLVLKKHVNINEFLREYEEFGGVSVCWYLFGSNGHLTHQESTILSYNKRVNLEDANNCHFHYKTIIMTDRTTQMEIHNAQYMNGFYAVDEAKVPTNGPFPAPNNININIIQLNHYVIRSLEDFQEKSKRSSGDGIRKEEEFFDRIDRYSNQVSDWSIIERHYPEYMYKKIEEEEAANIENIINELREEMANNR